MAATHGTFRLQVCLESSEQRPDGAVTFTAFGQIIRVSAHSEKALFLAFIPGLQSAGDALEGLEQQGTWQNNAEEEEAFLEAVTRQQPSQRPTDLLLKCRWAGAADWACWHVLKEAQSCTTGICCSPLSQAARLHTYAACHAFARAVADGFCPSGAHLDTWGTLSSRHSPRPTLAGGMRLATSRHGPSLRVLVSSAPIPPVDRADSTDLPRAAAMQLRVLLKCLQVSFWDDERRIILGPPVSGAPGTTPEQQALCLYVDSLTGSATFSQPQSKTQSTTACLAFWYPNRALLLGEEDLDTKAAVLH